MSSAPSCETESTIASAHTTALCYSKRVLPDCEREDCACDLTLLLRLKAGADNQFALRLKSSTALMRHCARLFVIDRARELRRLQEVSLSDDVDRVGGHVLSEIADRSDAQNHTLNREAFWQHFAAVSANLPERSRHILLRHYRDGLSHAEIAADSGISVDAISQTISRALKSIRFECDRQGVKRADLADPVSTPPTPVYAAGDFKPMRIDFKAVRKIILNLCQDLPLRFGK